MKLGNATWRKFVLKQWLRHPYAMTRARVRVWWRHKSFEWALKRLGITRSEYLGLRMHRSMGTLTEGKVKVTRSNEVRS